MAKSKDNSNATSEPVPITNAAPVASSNVLFGWVWLGVAMYVIGIIVKLAYRIRMGAIDEFGPVIHEFDPYFNYRATEVSASTGSESYSPVPACRQTGRHHLQLTLLPAVLVSR